MTNQSHVNISTNIDGCKTDVTIVVPVHSDRLSEYEMFSLRQMQKIFADRHFSVVCPSDLNGFVKNIFSGTHFETVNFDKARFSSIRAYNRLLTDTAFFTRFRRFDYIMICQLDAFVIEDALDHWMSTEYDFIGAPTFEGYENAKPGNLIYKTSLNGGFSLRKVASAINALEQVNLRFCPLSLLYKMEKSLRLKMVRLIRDGVIFNYNTRLLHPVINEDLFWSYVAPRLNKRFRVPGPDTAKSFAFDTQPEYLYTQNNNTLPMGIHAWWKYDLKFVRKILKLDLANPNTNS